MTIKFREHRGGLDASMETLVEISDRQALVKHIAKLLYIWADITVRDEDITVAPYGSDDRIGWKQVFIVHLEGFGVIGFTDTQL